MKFTSFKTKKHALLNKNSLHIKIEDGTVRANFYVLKDKPYAKIGFFDGGIGI